jgi:hypothetical protein
METDLGAGSVHPETSRLRKATLTQVLRLVTEKQVCKAGETWPEVRQSEKVLAAYS